MRRRLRTGLAVVALVGACAANEEARVGPSVPSATTTEPGSGAASGSTTVDHVVADGTTYEVTCATLAEGQLGTEAHELDVLDARFDGALEIVGEDPAVVLALRADGRVERCPEAVWVLGISGPNPIDASTATEHARLRCLVPTSPYDPRCGEGGPFWFGTDPSVDGTEGDGRSAVWIDGDAPPRLWRSDPLEVVAREVGEDPAVPDLYRMRRVGLRVLDERPEEVLVEVLYQDITDNAGQPWGTEQREHHTVRRLPGRQGWYPMTFIVADYADGDTDDAALDASWAAGLDRVLVEVDRR